MILSGDCGSNASCAVEFRHWIRRIYRLADGRQRFARDRKEEVLNG